MAICAGLHQSSIQRLKKTWKILDKKYISALNALMEIMDNKNNFKNYRELVAKRPKTEPMIGYMGIVLQLFFSKTVVGFHFSVQTLNDI
jgi:hypothetical protein